MRDYITCLITITRKMSPPQAMIRRKDFRTVEGLLELAVDAEQTLENSRTYRLPPPPAETLLLEMAYKPSSHTNPQRKPKEDAKEGKGATAVGMDIPNRKIWKCCFVGC